MPALPDAVAQEAYDHEVASAGFWPGGGGVDYAAFYAYAYPAPEGYSNAKVAPDAAVWHGDLKEFILPYEAVSRAPDSDAALLRFLETTYAAAANLGSWDRQALECAPGVSGVPRQLHTADVSPGERTAADTLDHGSALSIEHEEGASKGRYVLAVDGHYAEMTYSRAGEHLTIIDHTHVPDALRGRRMGEKLVQRAVEDARAGGKSILPLCPFAKAQIQRHPEWQDVLRR